MGHTENFPLSKDKIDAWGIDEGTRQWTFQSDWCPRARNARHNQCNPWRYGHERKESNARKDVCFQDKPPVKLKPIDDETKAIYQTIAVEYAKPKVKSIRCKEPESKKRKTKHTASDIMLVDARQEKRVLTQVLNTPSNLSKRMMRRKIYVYGSTWDTTDLIQAQFGEFLLDESEGRGPPRILLKDVKGLAAYILECIRNKRKNVLERLTADKRGGLLHRLPGDVSLYDVGDVTAEDPRFEGSAIYADDSDHIKLKSSLGGGDSAPRVATSEQ